MWIVVVVMEVVWLTPQRGSIGRLPGPPPARNVVLCGGSVVDFSTWLHRLLACLLVLLHVQIDLSIGGSSIACLRFSPRPPVECTLVGIFQRGSINCLPVCSFFCVHISISPSVAPSVACLWSPPAPVECGPWWRCVVVFLSWLRRLLACLLAYLHVQIDLSIVAPSIACLWSPPPPCGM